MAIYSRKKDKDGKVTKTFRNPITGKTRTIVKYKDDKGQRHKKMSVRTREQQAKYDKHGGHYQYETTKSKTKDYDDETGQMYKQFHKDRDLKGGGRVHKYREKGIVVKNVWDKGKDKKSYRKSKRTIFGPGGSSIQTMLKRDPKRRAAWKAHKNYSFEEFAKANDLNLNDKMEREIAERYYVKNPKRVGYSRRSDSRYWKKRR